MRQINWTDRKWSFDFPAEMFPAVVERLRGTPARITDLIKNAPHQMLTRRDANRWSVNDHIGHLIDLDDLDQTRLDEFIAGADTLTAADMSNTRTNEAGYNDVATATILEYFRARRLDLVSRLEQLSEEQVNRKAMHPRLKMPMRLVDWTYFVAEHDDHHVARMRELL
ncbi:MAG TPA: DinB family protein [Longimicrobiales bacterium]|nr:DinB family protein [Longimicrobiales bacterium]